MNCNIIYQAIYSYKYYVVEYLLKFHIVEQCIRLESIAASNNPGKASSILHSYYNEILTSIITPFDESTLQLNELKLDPAHNIIGNDDSTNDMVSVATDVQQLILKYLFIKKYQSITAPHSEPLTASAIIQDLNFSEAFDNIIAYVDSTSDITALRNIQRGLLLPALNLIPTNPSAYQWWILWIFREANDLTTNNSTNAETVIRLNDITTKPLVFVKSRVLKDICFRQYVVNFVIRRKTNTR